MTVPVRPPMVGEWSVTEGGRKQHIIKYNSRLPLTGMAQKTIKEDTIEELRDPQTKTIKENKRQATFY